MLQVGKITSPVTVREMCLINFLKLGPDPWPGTSNNVSSTIEKKKKKNKSVLRLLIQHSYTLKARDLSSIQITYIEIM